MPPLLGLRNLRVSTPRSGITHLQLGAGKVAAKISKTAVKAATTAPLSPKAATDPAKLARAAATGTSKIKTALIHESTTEPLAKATTPPGLPVDKLKKATLPPAPNATSRTVSSYTAPRITSTLETRLIRTRRRPLRVAAHFLPVPPVETLTGLTRTVRGETLHEVETYRNDSNPHRPLDPSVARDDRVYQESPRDLAPSTLQHSPASGSSKTTGTPLKPEIATSKTPLVLHADTTPAAARSEASHSASVTPRPSLTELCTASRQDSAAFRWQSRLENLRPASRHEASPELDAIPTSQPVIESDSPLTSSLEATEARPVANNADRPSRISQAVQNAELFADADFATGLTTPGDNILAGLAGASAIPVKASTPFPFPKALRVTDPILIKATANSLQHFITNPSVASATPSSQSETTLRTLSERLTRLDSEQPFQKVGEQFNALPHVLPHHEKSVQQEAFSEALPNFTPSHSQDNDVEQRNWDPKLVAAYRHALKKEGYLNAHGTVRPLDGKSGIALLHHLNKLATGDFAAYQMDLIDALELVNETIGFGDQLEFKNVNGSLRSMAMRRERWHNLKSEALLHPPMGRGNLVLVSLDEIERGNPEFTFEGVAQELRVGTPFDILQRLDVELEAVRIFMNNQDWWGRLWPDQDASQLTAHYAAQIEEIQQAIDELRDLIQLSKTTKSIPSDHYADAAIGY